jgi:DNA polymerase III epsilon subunit family exonuclease
MKFAVVDLETTGMHPYRDRVIEIGIVRMNGRAIGERFTSLVNPRRRVPAPIFELTGIDPDALQAAPEFEDVASRVREMIDGADYFVAHNARFDFGFLRAEFERLGWPLRKDVLCTVRLGRKIFPQVGRYNLDRLIEHFKIECPNRHRALDDALAAAELLRRYQRRRKAWSQALLEKAPEPRPAGLAALLDASNVRRRLTRDLAIALAPDRRGYERPEIVDRSTPGAFGPFRTRLGLRTCLETLVKAHGLCASVLGLERGVCSRRASGRCAGACEKIEPPESHNARLRAALAPMRPSEEPSTFAVLEPLPDGRRELFVFQPPFLIRRQVIDESIDEIPFDGALPSQPLDRNAWTAIRRHLERHPDRVIRRD